MIACAIIGAAAVVVGAVNTALVLGLWRDVSADLETLHAIIERQRKENDRLRNLLAQYQGEQSGN